MSNSKDSLQIAIAGKRQGNHRYIYYSLKRLKGYSGDFRFVWR